MKLEICPHESPEILEATADYFHALAEIGRKDKPVLHTERTLHPLPEHKHDVKDTQMFSLKEIQESEQLPTVSLEQCRAQYESDKAKESAEQVFGSSTPILPKLSFGLMDGKVELKGANNFPATVGLVTPIKAGKLYEPELDINGIPYDERIHSRGKSTLADGSWRIRRGVSDEQAREIEREILGYDAARTPGFIAGTFDEVYQAVTKRVGKIKIVSQTGITEQSSDLTPPPPPPPLDDIEELDAFDSMMDYVNDARKAGRITVAQIQEIAASIPGAVNMLNLSKPKNAHLVPAVRAAFVKMLEGK